MKIFLVFLEINCPLYYGYNAGLGYLSAVLKNKGYNIDYIVLRENKDILEFYKKVKAEHPEIIAFSSTTSQFGYLKDISKTARKISGSSFILCGGIHPTLKPECILEVPELDALVRGEGEYPLLELADALKNKKSYYNIRNFWFRKKDKIIKNKIRPLIKNLDELPFPDRESLNYQNTIGKAEGEIRFIFSRGCPFQCTYCSNKALSESYPNPQSYFRQRSPQKAIEEIEKAEKRFNFKFIVFDDDTISLNKKWFYEFFNLYKKKFKYHFRCNIRVDTIDENMIRILKEAGAERIGVGIEHGNENFRKKILKRNISDKQIIEAFNLCKKYNISHSDFMMVGLPFETKELFLDTVRLCRKVSARGDIGIFYPYPKTELGELCEKNKWISDKRIFKEREEAVISYPQFTKKEIQLCRDLFPYLLYIKFFPLDFRAFFILRFLEIFKVYGRLNYLKIRLSKLFT